MLDLKSAAVLDHGYVKLIETWGAERFRAALALIYAEQEALYRDALRGKVVPNG